MPKITKSFTISTSASKDLKTHSKVMGKSMSAIVEEAIFLWLQLHQPNRSVMLHISDDPKRHDNIWSQIEVDLDE